MSIAHVNRRAGATLPQESEGGFAAFRFPIFLRHGSDALRRQRESTRIAK